MVVSLDVGKSGSPVKTLPGFFGDLPFTLETGYIGVGESDDVQLFYYFFESERNPKNDPLMIWLTGGPGASVLSAIMYQIGPFTINNANSTLEKQMLEIKPYSWTKDANIIFIDQPAGSGFSYAKTPEAYITNDTFAAMHAYQFVKKWLLDHPKFLNNPFYVAGDSYAGILVPMIVQEIYNGNQVGEGPHINIKGYVLGNPGADTHYEFNSRIQYGHRMALLSDAIYKSTKEHCHGEYLNVDLNNTLCIHDLQVVEKCLGRIYTEHILEPSCDFSNSIKYDLFRRDIRSIDHAFVHIASSPQVQKQYCRAYNYIYTAPWANNKEVREALHIREEFNGIEWVLHNETLLFYINKKPISYTHNIWNNLAYHQNLTHKKCRALVYSGDHDLTVTYLSTLHWIELLELLLEDDWRPYFVDDQVAGYTKKYYSKHQYNLPPPPRLEGPAAKNLQLQFRTRMPPHLFTGGKVEGEQGSAIHVVLMDPNTGSIVQVGPESVAKLNVVVLEGDFNEEVDDDWTREHFESHEVKEREGKRPLLTGDLQVSLKEGVGTFGDLTFTDNSSWIRSRKFRLGVKVACGYCEEIRIREGKTETFAVKDHRGELYKKHYPPALHDEVWRLDRIAKDGALHKKLIQAKIVTVEDFLRLLVREPQKLRSILGSGMSNRMWENTVEHAKTCVLGGKLFVYYIDETNSSGIMFNNIYELRGLISDGQFFSLESLTPNQKMSVDSLVKKAYENWHRVVEYDGKVLNSHTNLKKESRAVATQIMHHNSFPEQQYTSAKNKVSYVSSEPNQHLQITNNYSSCPGLADYPFGRSDNHMVGMSLTDSQIALPGSMNYMSGENHEIGSTYFAGDWSRPRNAQGLEDIVAEELRLRSSEMLESDDMQRLLKTINAGVNMSTNLGHSNEGCNTYSLQYEPQMYHSFSEDQGKSSGKAVVGWLKLKAALRWGIFIRKKAAERRAQLTELN